MKSYKCDSILDLYQKTKIDDYLKYELVNKLTTNETWFFRHSNHFKLLKYKVFDEIYQSQKDEKIKRIKVWSAGCSNGAETYSILISYLEWRSENEDKNIDISIIGSDISTKAIRDAYSGTYNAEFLKDVDCNIRLKYFNHLEQGKYQVKPELKKYVRFENLNLVKYWPPREFDIIFCRNTMFYFSEDVKQNLIQRFVSCLKDNGYFFASTNELVDCKKVELKKVFAYNEIFYQKEKINKGKNLFVFKSSRDMFKAVTLLQDFKLDYNFLFNRPGVKRKMATRSFYIDNEIYYFVIKLFKQNSIAFEEEVFFY